MSGVGWAENLSPKMSHFPKLLLRLVVIFGMLATAAHGNLLVSIARRNDQPICMHLRSSFVDVDSR